MILGAARSWALATVMLAGLAIPATADTLTNLGPLLPNTTTNFTSVAPGVSGTFFNSFDFSVAQSGLFSVGSATNSSAQITNFAFELCSGTGSACGTLIWADGTPTADPQTGALFLSASGLLVTAGNYLIIVSGVVPAGVTTNYDGNLFLKVNPVPLPGALVLFGSGLVGLVALGRKRKQNIGTPA